MIIQITPIQYGNQSGTQLQVDTCNLILGSGLTVYATVQSVSSVPAPNPNNLNPAPAPIVTVTPVSATRVVKLTDAQYAGWTGDDTYVASCAATNLGLTPAS